MEFRSRARGVGGAVRLEGSDPLPAPYLHSGDPGGPLTVGPRRVRYRPACGATQCAASLQSARVHHQADPHHQQPRRDPGHPEPLLEGTPRTRIKRSRPTERICGRAPNDFSSAHRGGPHLRGQQPFGVAAQPQAARVGRDAEGDGGRRRSGASSSTTPTASCGSPRTLKSCSPSPTTNGFSCMARRTGVISDPTTGSPAYRGGPRLPLLRRLVTTAEGRPEGQDPRGQAACGQPSLRATGNGQAIIEEERRSSARSSVGIWTVVPPLGIAQDLTARGVRRHPRARRGSRRTSDICRPTSWRVSGSTRASRWEPGRGPPSSIAASGTRFSDSGSIGRQEHNGKFGEKIFSAPVAAVATGIDFSTRPTSPGPRATPMWTPGRTGKDENTDDALRRPTHAWAPPPDLRHWLKPRVRGLLTLGMSMSVGGLAGGVRSALDGKGMSDDPRHLRRGGFSACSLL